MLSKKNWGREGSVRCQPPEGQLLTDWLGTGLPGRTVRDFLSRVLFKNYYFVLSLSLIYSTVFVLTNKSPHFCFFLFLTPVMQGAKWGSESGCGSAWLLAGVNLPHTDGS